MTIKNQLKMLKENWLIVGIVVVVLLFMLGGSSVLQKGLNSAADYARGEQAMYAQEAALSYSKGGGYAVSEDFAPEAEERKITKTASMSNEVERGEFKDAESRLEAIIKSSDSYLLNQNVNKYGAKRESYYSGNYQIKVDSGKYDSVIEQLRGIGEVKSFNENARDITGTYTNTGIEIGAEKERLRRYEKMYEEAKEVSDKIELTDRIFNQERRIKYMEDSLKGMDQRIEYSTIFLSITEKKSDYYNVVFVKFSELIRSFVGSFNSLIKLLVVLLPWGIALWIIWLVVRFVKKGR